MKSRTTRRGLELTELGLGTAQFGNLYREATDDEVAAAVDAAWSAGVRYFDTAPHYGLGLSERRLGALLAGKPRDTFVISTKVGRLLEPSPDTAGRADDEGFAVPADTKRVWDFSRDGILRSVEDSLTRTGLDRLDVLYLHDPDDHFEEASTSGIGTLIELRDEGVVGAVGVGINQSEMAAEFVRRTDLDLVMLAGRYTLLEQGAATELLPLALEHGVGIVAAGVYNSGLLSTPAPSADAHYNYAQAPSRLVQRARDLAEVCARHGVQLPDAAVAFPLRHPAVVSVVLGSRNAAQATGNAERYAADIPDALWDELRERGLTS